VTDDELIEPETMRRPPKQGSSSFWSPRSSSSVPANDVLPSSKQDGREGHLAQWQGLKGFLDHTRAFIEKRDQTLQRTKSYPNRTLTSRY